MTAIVDAVELDVDFYVKSFNFTREEFVSDGGEDELIKGHAAFLRCKVTQCEVLCCLALDKADANKRGANRAQHGCP